MPGAQNQYIGAYRRTPQFAGLSTTAGNESILWKSPSGIDSTLRFNQGLSAGWPKAEVWRPVGVYWIVTTGTTVTVPKLTLRKNSVTAATGGVATLAIQAIDATQEFFSPFTDYTFAAADAAGDQWSVLVTTTSTAGVITVQLLYAVKLKVGINTGIVE